MARSSLKVPTPLAVSRAMNTLLEGSYWPATLGARDTHTRRQDDTDGQRGPDQDLSVSIGPDGDMWVVLPSSAQSLRFRTAAGGGQSLRVRNALMVLAEAIRRDNEDCPQPL